MDSRPGRRETTWLDDVRGGVRSIGLEALVVIALSLIAVIVAWVAITVV
ncbi:MAG: hypothetical protein U9N84_05975 [Actinomycetota bacterium]|nr:hypothetical protein [Actinomycetota bacterium]